MSYTMTRAERETIIRWDLEERQVHWYSTDPSQLLKMDRLSAAYPDVYKLVKRDEYGATYYFDPKYVRIGKPASEAVKEAARRKGAFLAEYRSQLTSSGDV